MAFNASVNLGTVGIGITGQTVSISGCTGSSCGSGCTSLATSQAVSSFPKTLSGIPDGTVSLFVKVDGGDCSGTSQCISITGLPGATPTPTSTATPTSTIDATPTTTATPTLTSTPTGTSTITPTVTTSAASGNCYSLTYTDGNSIDLLSVRYRNMSDTIVTEALTNLEAISNGDGTTTLVICVLQGQSYATPVCVQGGNEVTCDPFEWVQGGNCSTTGDCFVTPTITPTSTTTLYPEASFTTSTISVARTGGGAGTTSATSGTTITVINGTATVRLKVWVVTGYRADTTITINGNPYSPTEAGQGMTGGTGEGNASFIDISLPIGTYNVTNWTVDAISDGTLTVAQAKLEQV